MATREGPDERIVDEIVDATGDPDRRWWRLSRIRDDHGVTHLHVSKPGLFGEIGRAAGLLVRGADPVCGAKVAGRVQVRPDDTAPCGDCLGTLIAAPASLGAAGGAMWDHGIAVWDTRSCDTATIEEIAVTVAMVNATPPPAS